MIQEVLDVLDGTKKDESLYHVSYRYLLRDFENLLRYGESGYNPEIILEIIANEGKRRKFQYHINRMQRSFDQFFNTDTKNFRTLSERYREGMNYYRFASLRDKGIIRQKKETKKLLKELMKKYTQCRIRETDNYCNTIILPKALKTFCRELAGISAEEMNYLDQEITKFIKICPESYLKAGVFAKYLGSFFGVMKFNRNDPAISYCRKFRLGSCFGITYLVDDIIDDPAFSPDEKEDYSNIIFQILKSNRGEKTELSDNPLMAYTEHALITIRETLSEERWHMVASSYSVIATASVLGAKWTNSDSLSDEDVYVNAALKGSYTRVIPAILADCTITGHFLSHCLRTGYIYQLHDDLRDIPEDLTTGTITPFIYFTSGKRKLRCHPLTILLMVLSRIAYVDYPEMKDACPLLLMVIYRSLKVLSEKIYPDNLCNFFRSMDFPEDPVTRQLCLNERYWSMVLDFETETAEKWIALSIDAKKSM